MNIMCYDAEFGPSRSNHVYAYVADNPQNWGPLGPRRLGVELPKTSPAPVCVPYRIWSFCDKGCRHKYRRTPKLGSAGLHFLGMGGVADPNIHAPPHICYLAELERSALKDAVIHRKESPKLGSARLRLFWVGCS